MSVYNGEKFLKEAIESILNQSLSDFEFLIIDDGCTDRSVEIIKSINDQRIRLVHNKKNIGLTKSLNKGLKIAKGKYIARMDADDISLPLRLKKQVNLLEERKEIGLAGSWFSVINSDFEARTLESPEEIKIELLFRNSIGHPTVMFRKELVEKYDLYYNENFRTSQDHELWYRMAEYTDLSNIPEVLVLYRSHDGQVSKRSNFIQNQNSERIRHLKINDFLGREVGSSFILALNAVLANRMISATDFGKVVNLLNDLYNKNQLSKKYSSLLFRKYLNRLLKRSFGQVEKIDLKVIRDYLSSDLKSVRDIKYIGSQIYTKFI